MKPNATCPLPPLLSPLSTGHSPPKTIGKRNAPHTSFELTQAAYQSTIDIISEPLISLDHESAQKDDILDLTSIQFDTPLPTFVTEIDELEQWRHIINNFERIRNNQPKYLKQRIREGIPKSVRGYVWQRLALSHEMATTLPESEYFRLRSWKEGKWDTEILRDISRTFPQHELFKHRSSLGQELLFKVLRAYANYNPDVGYCQGMGFLAGVLLMHMDETSAFSVLVCLMNRYEMASLFRPGFPLLEQFFYQFEHLLEMHLPDIYNHLREEHVDATMYASQWFMTIFSYNFPFDIVVRIWDIFLNEGVKTIFRVALAIFKLQTNLKNSHFEAILHSFKHAATTIHMDRLLETALSIKISQADLDSLKKNYQLSKQASPHKHLLKP